MPWWQWLVDSVLGVVLLSGLLVLLLVMRRRGLAKPSGTFDLSINRRAEAGQRGWTLGVARYTDEHLEWFRTFSLSPRPRYRFERGHLEVGRRRLPEGREAYAVHAGHVVVPCESPNGVRQLALSPRALTGLLSWLESSPPGRRVNNVL